LDEHVPLPPREVDRPFLMPVEGVYSVKGRGTVVTGRIERGRVRRGDNVVLVGPGIAGDRATVVVDIEQFREVLEEGVAGDNAGVLLRSVEADEVGRGVVVAAPKSVTAYQAFEAEVYVLSKEEGGRHTPFFSGYRPQFYFRTTDVPGAVSLAAGVDMALPGDTVGVSVALDAPDRAGAAAAVCRPRGRQDGRLGRDPARAGVGRGEMRAQTDPGRSTAISCGR
jgi:elongation factor Tu